LRSLLGSLTGETTKLDLDLMFSTTTGEWGDYFRSALQTTAGSEYGRHAEAPVEQAIRIADEAALRSGALPRSTWVLYMEALHQRGLTAASVAAVGRSR
jgi:hypothetical protein